MAKKKKKESIPKTLAEVQAILGISRAQFYTERLEAQAAGHSMEPTSAYNPETYRHVNGLTPKQIKILTDQRKAKATKREPKRRF